MCRIQIVGVVALAVLVSLVSAGSASGQVTLDPTWPENPRTFGGKEGDWALSVQPTSDGGYIVVGFTESFGAGDSDVYLIKLDSHGNFDPAWDSNPKVFGGPGREIARFVQQTVDGGYIVVGNTASLVAGDWDLYLIKLDSEGYLDAAWGSNPKTLGGPDSEQGRSAQETADGGYLVAGWTYFSETRQTDVCFWKLDKHGDLDPVWDPNPRVFGGPANDLAECLLQTTDGGYIAGGYTDSFGAGDDDVYLIKLDMNGSLDSSWDINPRTFGGPARDVGVSVQQTRDSGYIVAGFTESFGAGGYDVYLIKLDSRGRLDATWDSNPKTVGGNRWDWGRCVQQTSDGGYIVVGHTQSLGDGGDDVYLIKLDRHGSIDAVWDPNPMVFGGHRYDRGDSVRQTIDGGYIVAGTTESTGAGGPDFYLVRLSPARHFLRGDCNGDGTTEGIPDAVALLYYNFIGGDAPPCLAACDANGDADIFGTTDAIYILSYFFLGSEPPPSPFPTCELAVVREGVEPECRTQLVCQ